MVSIIVDYKWKTRKFSSPKLIMFNWMYGAICYYYTSSIQNYLFINDIHDLLKTLAFTKYMKVFKVIFIKVPFTLNAIRIVKQHNKFMSCKYFEVN